MTKRIISKVALIMSILLLFSIATTACSDSENISFNPLGLVIILGNHANANSITDDVLDKYDELLKKAFVFSEEGGRQKAKLQLNVIISDGKPQVESIDNYIEKSFEITANTTRNRDLQIEKLIEEIKALLISDNLRAKDPEVDLLKAITEAKYSLEHMQGDKYILILDSGLPTTGSIDFTKINIQKLSVQDAIDTIPEGSIPDLSGIKVYFEGLANVAFPQCDEVRETDIANKLIDFWTNILGDSLADSIKIANHNGNPMIHSNESANSYPRVTSIAITPKQIDVGPIEFHADTIGFLPDSAEFVDEDAAINYISLMAENIKIAVSENPELDIYVVGSIARVNENDEPQRTSKYSRNRANAVADILINNLGIPSENIITIDAGMTEFSWREADEFEGDEAQQIINRAKNRVVYVFCQQPDQEPCDELQELIDAEYINN